MQLLFWIFGLFAHVGGTYLVFRLWSFPIRVKQTMLIWIMATGTFSFSMFSYETFVRGMVSISTWDDVYLLLAEGTGLAVLFMAARLLFIRFVFR